LGGDIMSAEQVIEALGLVPLEEEGGMMRSTYVSAESHGDGPLATAIYYFLSGNAFSHLHRLEADELYHHYMGDAVELSLIDEDGKLTSVTLGSDLLAGETPQALAPKGSWQGSRLKPGGAWALLGTTMAPGYTQASYRHADADALIRRHPQHEALIRRLTGEARYR
jgi:predicted cupin superfamily sugar epimerase